jgi:hypothetical protein
VNLRPFVFERYPQDWVGRRVFVFRSGFVGLDSGLLTKENLAREAPLRSLLITEAMLPGDVTRFLDDATAALRR